MTSLVLSFRPLRRLIPLSSRWTQNACIATLWVLLPLMLLVRNARAEADSGTEIAPDAGTPGSVAAPSSPTGVTGSADAGDAAPPTSAENPAPPPPAAETTPSETPDAGPAVDTDTALKSVVVTAEKREENIQKVPLSITAVSGDRVRSLGVEASSDVPRLVPNMSAATTEGRSRPRWFIRGVGNNDTSSNAVSPVGVYFDEVYENFVLGQAFLAVRSRARRGSEGPQGTLWGKNTTGGAISFISRKPSFEPDAYAEATVGNHAEFGLQGAGGGPIIKDTVAARASFFYESRNGWVTNIINNQTQGDIRDAAGRVQVLITPIDALEATLSVHFRHNDGQSQAFYLVQSNGTAGPIPGFNGFKEGSRWYTAENNGPDIDVDDQKGGSPTSSSSRDQ